eukprot:TRINITY_DN3516_c0_g1_i1.p1 TRINITY_DN3516_c0_g1~~TRINITY_DN3516_c0_g1_i1.p1  ORF type:complete len:109 (-),score=22.00 TRINITY_DN3516_c0_g1_i1:521-847(-)
MGQSVSRSCQTCWDPEGTASIVRKKKAQRAAINKYTQLFTDLESASTAGDPSAVQGCLAGIKSYDKELRGKSDGNFLGDLKMHNDWQSVAQKRQQLCDLLQGQLSKEP